MKELVRARLSNSVSKSEKDAIKIIIESVKKFSPSILMHGKNQVYWDVDSYIHITVRHLKDYQLGNYQNKTPLPYKADDLELLIEEVLCRVEDEIRQYLLKKPTDNFTRHGKMAIYFNGDYYHLRINKEGRLTQFHTI